MPVIVNSQNIHPFLTSLGGVSAIEESRAFKQDIRPLEILVLNLMADKQTTERQLSRWLGHTALQVKLTFAATDSYVDAVKHGRPTVNTSVEHIRKFYHGWSEVKHNKYDGFIVTGVNALKPRVEQEKIWPEVEEIFAWSETNVFSSLFLCWGAKAALKYFHNIDSQRHEKKLWGVFPHQCVSDATGILFGFADTFDMPVSRWKGPRLEDLEACKAVEIVATSREVGPNLLVEKGESGAMLFQRRLYLLGHPEYDTETLQAEYDRDKARDGGGVMPVHYFTDDDPDKPIRNLWRPTAHIYTNWLQSVYGATPYNLEDIPAPFAAG